MVINTHTSCKLYEDPRRHKCSSEVWYTMAKKIQVSSDEEQEKPWVDCGVHFRHQYLTTEIWPIYLQAPNINFASGIWLLRQSVTDWKMKKKEINHTNLQFFHHRNELYTGKNRLKKISHFVQLECLTNMTKKLSINLENSRKVI